MNEALYVVLAFVQGEPAVAEHTAAQQGECSRDVLNELASINLLVIEEAGQADKILTIGNAMLSAECKEAVSNGDEVGSRCRFLKNDAVMSLAIDFCAAHHFDWHCVGIRCT
ncbi:hypothetical protein D3C77_439010 [compost metagenome]